MKFSVSLLVLTLLHLGSTQAMHQEGAFHAENQELGRDESERFLVDPCEDFYFVTTIAMDSHQSLSCTDSQLKDIGAQLDELYDEVVNRDPALSHIALSTNVCSTPKVSSKRRDLLSRWVLNNEEEDENQRTLQQKSFKLRPITVIYSGFGRCNFCPKDNADGRRLSAVEGEIDRQEEVAHNERKLREAYSVIDFGVDDRGNKLTNGMYVMNEWRNKYGMRVVVEDAKGGYAPNGKARIFDSSNPKGDLDLGTPNAKCPGGGPGVGLSGEPGQPGENCIPQGNLLIIQESNKALPDDNQNGGVISFIFDSPKRIGHIAMIDGSNTIEAVTPDGKIVQFKFPSEEGNSAHMLHLDIAVKKIKMILSGGGGISEIGIFTPTKAEHALSPEARSHIAKKSPLQEYIPYLEHDLSYYLTTRINDMYGQVASSCLHSKWVEIHVQMEAVKQLPNNICL